MLKPREYEEKACHGTLELPIALHKLQYPQGSHILFYPHWHNEFELFLVTQGSIEITIEEQSYVLSEGECSFISSNKFHSGKAIEGKPCSFCAIDFSYTFIHHDLHSPFGRKYISPLLNESLSFLPMIREDDDWQSKLLSYVRDISLCKENTLAENELLIKSKLYAIWDLYYSHGVINHPHPEISSISQERLQPVLHYISQNYANPITLKELASLIPMSQGRFCKSFKEIMGVSPITYLMLYRIKQSCKLLLDTDKKIGEIADLSGFDNISYFNKIFLKNIGCTPKQYRKGPLL